MSNNTAERPSDFAPPCPDCETDVFVDRSKTSMHTHVCHFCGARWADV